MYDSVLPPGAAWDGIGVLIAQHRQVDAIWDRLDGSAGILTEARRLAMAQQLVRLLSIHDSVEHLHLYPLVRRSMLEGDGLADQAEDSHQEQVQRLAVLDGTRPGEAGFDRGWTELMAEVHRHVRFEEQEIFPRLLESVDRFTLTLLATRIERAARIAPTHPHPRFRLTLGRSRVGAPAIGTLDRTRDAMRRQPSGGEDVARPPEGTVR